MRLSTTALVAIIFSALCITVQAQNNPALDVYNPSSPAIQSEISDGSDQQHQGESFDKTALVVVPQAFTAPTIDGVLSPGEWTGALTLTGLVRWGGSGATVYMKNDACYLYVGVDLTNAYVAGNQNANMINFWFDVNRNGVWDSPNDGNLSLPAPGYLYPPDVASFGYYTLPGWVTSFNRIRYHRPWATLGIVPSTTLIEVKRVNVGTGKTYIEAKIDYKNGPVKLTGGVSFNMRFQTYAGYYTGGGSVAIQTNWPTIDAAADYNGPLASGLGEVQLTNVIAAGNFFDVTGVSVADNPEFDSKAFVTGTSMNMAIEYTLNDPPPQTIDYRARFYGPFPGTALATTETGSVTVNSPSGIAYVEIPVNVPIGFYSVEVEADDPEVCGIEPRTEINNILVLGPGQTPCSVFPGDVNVDGVVNYGDKQSLWNYIQNANLNPNWLQGYYRLAPSWPTPLAEIEYVGQAALPWNTPQGCHMDTDGNGAVNTFDYVAIKTNWYRTHDAGFAPKNDGMNAGTFDLSNNYPNPFNPSTRIQYAAPERSHVTLTVSDILGRTVQTLVNRAVEPGTYTVEFDGTGLTSGTYVATVTMQSEESGLSFTKTIKMVMNK